MKKLFTCLSLSIPLLLSCHPARITTGPAVTAGQDQLFTPGPKTIVYKTGGDYFSHVPVTMDKDRRRIVSYPAPPDLYYKGTLALPTRLAGGYLLDNRGIGPNTVFLDYTYEEYVRLKSIPSGAELAEHIIDKYPFTAMWECGNRSQFKNEVKELNELIGKGFRGCKKIGTGSTAFQKDPDFAK